MTKRDEKVNCVQCMTQSYTSKDTKREVPGENEGLFKYIPSSEGPPRFKKKRFTRMKREF